MGTISLQIPQSGLPNSTEDPKIASDLTTIQTTINGNIDTNNLSPTAGVTDTQIASPNNAHRKLLLQASSTFTSLAPLGTYMLTSGGNAIASNTNTTSVPPIWMAEQGSEFTVAGKTSQAVVRATVWCSTIAPAMNFTVGLYRLASGGLGGSGGNLVIIPTGPFTNSTVAINAPAAAQEVLGVSSAFALPTTGAFPSGCVLGVVLSAAPAVNSLTAVSAQLFTYNS